MKFLFVHSWKGFSLAEWCLRDAVVSYCPIPVEFRSIKLSPDDFDSRERFRELFISWKPGLIGFSCHSWDISAFIEAAEWARSLAPDTGIVLGGPQVSSTFAASEILSRKSHVDYVIRDYGEAPLARLIETIYKGRQWKRVPGLSYRGPKGVVHNDSEQKKKWERGLIFHPGNRDLDLRMDGLFEASYETLRGCKNSCIYCMYPGNLYAMLDLGTVRKELAFICSFSIPHLRICDSHFGGSSKRAKVILRELVKVNRGTSVKIYPDLAHIDTDYLTLARDANAEITSIGIQTTCRYALRAVGRRALHDNRKAIEMILAAFPETPADLITGLPGDSPEGVEQSIRDVLEMGFRRINAFRLAVFPGTPLAENVQGYLGTGEIAHTSQGRILHSPAFPPESQQRVTSAVNAGHIASLLRATGKALGDEGEAVHVFNQLMGLDPDVLMDINNLLSQGNPAVLFSGMGYLIDVLEGLEGERAMVRDAIIEDCLICLLKNSRIKGHRRMAMRDKKGMTWKSRIIIKRETGGYLSANLESGEMTMTNDNDYNDVSYERDTVCVEAKSLSARARKRGKK